MNTFLIISTNKELREQHAVAMATQKNISPFDISFLETEGSIGIEAVRNFQKNIMFKPLKGESKAAVIKDAHTLTTEAQNALLKTLEEPPDHTDIYLTVDNANNLLPTILSRTSIIELAKDHNYDPQSSEEIQAQIQTILSSGTGERLKLAETLAADKQEAIIWIERAMYILRSMMLATIGTLEGKQFPPLLESLQKTYITLKTTNTNTRLTLENLFLNL